MAGSKRNKSMEGERKKLPLQEPELPWLADSPPPPPPTRVESLEPTVILLAEDDADMRDLLAQAFRGAGYEVIEAKNGTELLNFAATGYLRSPCTLPDIIVSDVRMPGFTGMEVLAGLRSSDWAMPVVLISAFADPATHDEALRLGAATLLNKPFDVEELLATVEGLVPPFIH